MENPRFKDTGETIYDFFDCVLVECPRCHGCAKITGNPYKTNPRLVCGMCGMCGLTDILQITSFGDSAEYCGIKLVAKD